MANLNEPKETMIHMRRRREGKGGNGEIQYAYYSDPWTQISINLFLEIEYFQVFREEHSPAFIIGCSGHSSNLY